MVHCTLIMLAAAKREEKTPVGRKERDGGNIKIDRELGEGKWGSEHMHKAGKVRRGCRIKTGKKVKSKL